MKRFDERIERDAPTGKLDKLADEALAELAAPMNYETLCQSRFLGTQNVRLLADKNYALLKENSRHPSLQFKKIWSALVGSCGIEPSRTCRRDA
jgi:hypothetical protein